MPDITDRSTLRETLEAHTVERLKPRAAHCADNLPTRKADLINVIVSTIHTPERLRELWRKLDDLSQQAVAHALENDGKLSEDAFRAQYGTLPWERGKKKSVGYLNYYGKPEYTPVEVLIYNARIPPDVAPLLKPLAPPAEKFVLTGLNAVPEEQDYLVAETEEAALHDLAATLSLIAEGKATATPKTGQPAAATVAKLAGRLWHGEFLPADEAAEAGEPIRAFGWLTLAQAAQLAKADGSKLTLTPKGQKALSQPDVAGLRDIFDKWSHSNEFDELSRISALRGQKGRRTHLTRPSERKRKILDALARCPAGQWIEVEDFFRAVRAWRRNFEVEAGYGYSSAGGLYVGSSWEYGYLDGFGSAAAWRAVQAQYILVCLWEYLGTLGALDLAYGYPEDADFSMEHISGVIDDPYFSRYVGLRYFRLNPLGAYLLGLADDYAGPARASSLPVFTVTANHEIAITHRDQFTPNVRALLERLAEPVSEGVYRLDRARILAGLETGLTLDAITDFLSGKSAQPVPQAVRVFLDDIQRNSRALQEAGPAILFNAADAPLAQLLVNDTVLRKFCLLGGEATLVVPAEKEAAFRRRLKQLGYGVRR